MKKFILVFALFIICSHSSFGSHLIGGEITARNMEGLTYEVTFNYYYDPAMTGVQSEVLLGFINTDRTWALSQVAYLSSAVYIANGYQKFTYLDTITFPESGFYKIIFEECCRDFQITNLNNPGDVGMGIHNLIFADSTNSSPVFLNSPIVLADVNDPFSYNPLAFDADGDSLVYSIGTPLDFYIDSAITLPGFTLPTADPSMPFSINSSTGQISFLPSMQTYSQYMVLVKEYRNGVFIGEIERDMPLLVGSSTNTPALVSDSTNTSPFSGKQFNIAAGNTFTLSFVSTDADNMPVSMASIGESMQLASNPSIFNSMSIPGMATGQFTWTPDMTQQRNNPYIIAIRVSENHGTNVFENDITYSLRVVNFTGVGDYVKTETINTIYPNPNQGNFAVELNIAESGSMLFNIYNLIGEQVYVNNISVNKGINVIDIQNLHLQAGNYFITVEQHENKIATKEFEIIK